MTAPSEGEATIAVDAAARKAWDLQRAELRDRGFPSPEFDDLDPMERHRIRNQVLPLVWAALEVLPRPSEIRNQVAESIEAYAEATRTQDTWWEPLADARSNWIGALHRAAQVARGENVP